MPKAAGTIEDAELSPSSADAQRRPGGRPLLPANWALLLVVVILAASLFSVPFLRELRFPSNAAFIPFYALSSLYRMWMAYALSLVFALGAGYYAATRPSVERVLIPIIDVLQSVPILGFFPAAIVFFISVFPWSGIGVEFAAIFLIFTSMAWNMMLSVYESMKSIPNELLEVASLSKLDNWTRFKKVLVPVSLPKLIYNSVVSWAVGWYFLMASEIISFGTETHHLPGLGTYLVQATSAGDTMGVLLGLAALVIVISLLNFLVFRPLMGWADKFKLDTSTGRGVPKRSLAQALFFWVPPQAGLIGAPGLLQFLFDGIEAVGRRFSGLRALAAKLIFIGYRFLKRSFVVLSVVLFFYLVFLIVPLFLRPIPTEALALPALLFFSFLRIFVAYLLCLLWTVPAAVYLGTSPKGDRWISILEIVASIPSTAFLPPLILGIMAVSGSADLAVILLILLGIQWYVFFNVLGAVRSMPKDYSDVGHAFGLSTVEYWKQVVLPAIFPSLITGSITAWGGAWNTLVVVEYVTFSTHLFSVPGIGSFISNAVYAEGSSSALAYGLALMTVAVLLMNRLVWRPLYELAYRRYRWD